MAVGISVRVQPDRLSASVVVPQTIDGDPVSEEAVLNALKGAGVVNGIDLELVRQAVELAGSEMVVARGTPPSEGIDGRIEWMAEITTSTGRPEVMEDGRVDYHNLNMIGRVSKDQVLAVRIPAQPGQPGQGIDGQSIQPKPPKEATLPKGKNLVHSTDGREIRAGIDGHLTMVGSGYAVLPTLEISGNVDFSTGDIDFPGTVRVLGNVGNGFLVRASGDVFVGGGVAGGKIEAVGSLTTARGIVGGIGAYVKAGTNINARFIENGDVSAGGHVNVSDAIMHSRVSAGGKITVSGHPGTVVGGLLRARQELSCKMLGGNLAANTEVEVGVNPADRQRLKELIPRLAQVVREEEKAMAAVRMIADLKFRGQMPVGINQEMVSRLANSLETLHSERQDLESELDELQNRLQAVKAGRVVAKGAVRAGVKITIGTALLSVDEDLGPAGFTLSPAGDVVIGPV